jgi:hypothetical protein
VETIPLLDNPEVELTSGVGGKLQGTSLGHVFIATLLETVQMQVYTFG